MTGMSGINREAMWGHALRDGNAGVMERSQQLFDKTDRGRNCATATPLEGAR
jgi:hypothetical protein